MQPKVDPVSDEFIGHARQRRGLIGCCSETEPRVLQCVCSRWSLQTPEEFSSVHVLGTILYGACDVFRDKRKTEKETVRYNVKEDCAVMNLTHA